MKRVLFVINSLDMGGAEKSLTSLLNCFDYKSYIVDLQMFRNEGALIKALPNEVNVLPPLRMRRQAHKNYLIFRLRMWFGIRVNQKTHRLHPAQCFWKYAAKYYGKCDKIYDVAIAWGQGNPTHYVAEKVNARKKIAFINADYEKVGHNKEFDLPFYLVYHNIVTVSDELNHIMKRVFPSLEKRFVTIYDITNATMIEQMAQTKNPLKGEMRTKLVTVGRMAPSKNYLLLVQTAAELKKRNVVFVWFVVGDGGERPKIENWIMEYGVSDCVCLIGAKTNPYPYMKYADIYVQTSKDEGYCLTVAEARILNKPVVCTDFEVIHNQIINGENGLIASMNAVSLADAIVRLNTNRSLYENIVNNLRKQKKGNLEEIEKLYDIM